MGLGKAAPTHERIKAKAERRKLALRSFPRYKISGK